MIIKNTCSSHNDIYSNAGFEEFEIEIGQLKELLTTHDVQIDSADGWVPVLDFVDKGEWDEYVLKCNGREIRCNENHLFETSEGWRFAKDMLSSSNNMFLFDDGKFHRGVIIKTGNRIPIVDIQVGHENQRYYSNGVSSHNTAVGKSLAMCHLAAAALAKSRNVLYITMEMAEEKIAERIDANLFDVDIQEIVNLSEDMFKHKVKNIAAKTHGKLIIKEYPTGAAHAGHFRALLMELKLKKNFVPDMIFIDYLNICASSRLKGGDTGNSYGYIKAIAEELRGLGVEFNVPIWSATQVTRSGYCLDSKTIVKTLAGDTSLNNVSVGDYVETKSGIFNEVLCVFPKTKKKAYKITLESGKTIICSADHKFPTENKEFSINDGLICGMKLCTKK